jgi:hypothetical protein
MMTSRIFCGFQQPAFGRKPVCFAKVDVHACWDFEPEPILFVPSRDLQLFRESGFARRGSAPLHQRQRGELTMKKSFLILLTAALAIAPTAAFATFSVIQDSCRTEGNTETTYFSVVNFNSPVPV